MDNKQYGAWIIELSNYFIKNYGYQLITMSKNNDEIWIVNAENKTTPIIMITTQPTQNLQRDVVGKHRESLAIVFKTQPIGLNISVNAESLLMDEYNVLVSEGVKSDSLTLSQFTGISSVLKNTGNPERSLTRAVMDLRKTMNRSQKKARLKFFPGSTAISIVAVAMFTVISLLALNGIEYDFAAIMMGGFYKRFVVDAFEIWRFITSAFVHVDLFHLLLSLMALRNMAAILEPTLGWKKFVTIFFSGIFVGNIFLFIAEDTLIGIGMGGGLFALLGALLVYLYETQGYRNPRILSQMTSVFFVNIFLTLIPGVSGMSLLGGLFIGVLFGFMFSRRNDWLLLRKGLRIMVPVFVIALVAVMLTRRVPAVESAIDKGVIASWRDLGFTWYSDHLSNLLK
ncbi:rhomboid family intramembrane serine protease [Erysipelothrix sp. HDW6C]|uniref:rhomboid family intramembrane serine protease n=1 Tax=Erysipelothrix sp. HDW6C TaxID=2714930 RepID=UPI00140C867A|nr:rhomboid family intramembrane serine protease [Erysipelothrix sp. HDW6C]QIK69878.1 rhomboid family intramembrane serine protease [Erysipelothrix sp. HDW6C]